MKIPAIHAKGDRTIWIIVLLLSLLSLFAVYSSTGKLAHTSRGGNTEYFLIKQLVLVGFGLFLMYTIHRVHFRFFSRIGQIAAWISVPLLIFTLMSSEVNDASRWLTIPIINATFQTSDLAKLALILYVSRLLARKQDNIKDFRSTFVPIIIPILIICMLILPANFSTAAMLFGTCMVLMFVGGINIRYLLALLGIAIVGFSLFIVVMLNFNMPGRIGTWKARVERFIASKDDSGKAMDKTAQREFDDANYQPVQAKIAIANGGFLGRGPGNSEQRNFLPHPYSDFIFAIILEEGGLIVGFFVLLLYMVLLLRVIQMVRYSPRLFATFLAVGCTLLLIFQAFINMAVAVNLFPVTGQPLPLVSMGGTSTLFTSCAFGIILSVSRFCVKDGGEEAGDEEA
jgi:cell division protein FtsW